MNGVLCGIRKAATGTVVFVEEEEGRRNNLAFWRWILSPHDGFPLVSRLLNLFPRTHFCYLVGNACMRESFFLSQEYLLIVLQCPRSLVPYRCKRTVACCALQHVFSQSGRTYT